MVKYFLIDTNIWIEIISEGKSGHLLDKLCESVRKGKAKCLVPEIVEMEWNKNKKLHLQDVQKTYKKVKETFTHRGSNNIKYTYSNEVKMIKKKISQIDELVKQSLRFEISDNAKVKAVDFYRLSKAPFHNKEGSLNDALIYFGSIDYLKEKGLEEFVFVTRNSTDFSLPNEPFKLHTDLHVDGITCDYYLELGKAFHRYSDELGLGDYTIIMDKPNKYQLKVFDKGNQNLLKHLHKVLKHVKGKIDFVPTSILSRMEPFRIENTKRDYSYYSCFRLHTNNDELVDMFDGMIIEDAVSFKNSSKYENSEQNIRLASEIIEILNHNSVYELASVNTQKLVYIELKSSSICECATCCYERLEFNKSLQVAMSKQRTVEERFKAAFVFFHLDFYDKAAEVLIEILKYSRTKGLNLIKFRALYNLHWLNTIAGLNHVTRLKVDRELINLDLTKEYFDFALEPELDEAIASYYHNTDFNLHYSDEINVYCDKISEHYNLQLNGGHSSNSNYLNLLATYSEYEMFVRCNSLLFFKFSNHQEIFRKFSTSLIEVFSYNKYQGEKVLLNDYHLIQMVHYGNISEIAKKYNSVSRSLIEYEDDATSNFPNSIRSYLTLIRDRKFGNSESDKNLKPMPHEKYFVNILTVLTIVNFKHKYISETGKLIYDCLIKYKLGNGNLEYLGWYLNRVRPLLNHDLQKRYFNLFLSDSKFHNRDLFYCFKGEKDDFLISDERTYSLVKECFFVECKKCKEYHTDSLVSLFSLLNSKYKVRLRRDINKQLGINYDAEKYYYFAIHDVIVYKKYFPKYLESFPLVSGKEPQRTMMMRGEIIYLKLSNLLNLVFKNGITLPSEFIERHRGISDYYNWILDINEFDYSNFDPLWVSQYNTRFYLHHVFKSAKVREAVRIYLRNNYQPALAKYYVSYVK